MPVLVGLAAPRPVVLIDPADAMLVPLRPEACQSLCAWPLGVYRGLGVPDRMQLAFTAQGGMAQLAEAVDKALAAASPDY